jgi:hypothetical protein
MPPTAPMQPPPQAIISKNINTTISLGEPLLIGHAEKNITKSSFNHIDNPRTLENVLGNVGPFDFPVLDLT